MSNPRPPRPGTIVWTDLTVPDAERIREFFCVIRDPAGAYLGLIGK